MSFDTLRTSKMRSALTVLGVVIGITSIVGMTSLIRGFDESLRESMSAAGPNTIYVQKMGAVSWALGQDVPGSPQAAEPHGRRRARRSSATARRWRSWTSGSAPWAATAGRASITRASGPSRSRSSARPRTLPTSPSRRSWRGGSSCPRRSNTGGRSSCWARPRTSRSSRTSTRSASRSGSAATSSPSSAWSRSARRPGASTPAPTTSP